MTSIAEIEQTLAGYAPRRLAAQKGTRAAVALILNQTPDGPCLLFIRRAVNDNDPWSGNISFPGGKVENGDGEPRLTAERETLEETGLDLRKGRFLGRLSDIAGTRIPVHVSCFVYLTAETGPFRLMDDEVQEAFWVPLEALTDPARRGLKEVRFDGRTMVSQGISLPHPEEPVLWGLTYMLVMEFLELLGEGAGRTD